MSIWLAAAVLVILLGAGLVYEYLSERGDRKRYPPPGTLLDVSKRRVHLFCQGNAPGPTVVIEQGMGSPSIVWRSVQAGIAEFARVCTYDRAGYLWSDPASGPRSIEDRVADLHAVLLAGAVPAPYVLVGHSLGGLIVRRFAAAYPNLVAGIVLVDAPDEIVIFRDAITAFYRQGARFQRFLRLLARFGVVRLLGRRVPMLMLPDDETGYALCVTPNHAAAAADDMQSLLNASTDVRKPQVPGVLADRPLLLLMHGIPFPPMAAAMEEGWADSQQRLLALSSDSDLIMANNSGHLIHVDEPALVIAAVRRVHAAARAGIRLKS
jgi:pimeloyl-ACP methyl ester carboxylesterase